MIESMGCDSQESSSLHVESEEANHPGSDTYDCEYVALAEFLDLTLVMADAKLAKAFPRRMSLLGAG
jgi:predicted nucleic acid-binding protein